MKLANSGTVPVYTVSGSSIARALPDWLARQRKRSLRNDAEYQNRVDIIQDFEFEEAGVCVRVSENGEFLMSTGTYKPQIRVHHLPELSLSYSRHTNSLNHSFVFLAPDGSKSLHLQTDRLLEFHTLGGLRHHVRIPRYGRAVVYDRHSAEALVPAVGLDADGKGEVFRLNLELGRFMRSYQVDLGSNEAVVERGLQGGADVGSVNAAAIAENSHNLLAFGTSLGTEFWDPRSRTRVAYLSSPDGEVTAVDFNPSGMSIVTGSSAGNMQIFDLRRPVPLLQKDQGYGFPIQKILHLNTISHEHKILSADKRIVKIWDAATGAPWTSVEPEVDINDVAWCRDTGMILGATEGRQQHAWFVPSLGPAPRWCGFLDNLVEEMAEEVRTETYDNYKFLTVPELKALSLGHLVGKSNLLRPYMHGYFVASRLYDQARLIVNPYMWEEERAKRVRARVEKERASRIRGSKKKVKVNQQLVDRLLQKQANRAQVDSGAGILGDDRFTRLFEDEEFVVDENSREFRAHNPNRPPAPPGVIGAKERNRGPAESDESGDEGAGPSGEEEEAGSRFVMKVSSSRDHGRPRRDTALGSRVQTAAKSTRRGHVVGGQQITFTPKAQKPKKAMADAAPPPRRRMEGRRSASNNVFRGL